VVVSVMIILLYTAQGLSPAFANAIEAYI